MKYPPVSTEFETVEMLRRGFSIARFGDGELKMINGKGYIREPGNRLLGNELHRVLNVPHYSCLVGIPTMDPAGPKYHNWVKHTARFEKRLKRPGPYYSAFISRPDSAPWIRTRGYALAVQNLWVDKRVAVICEKGGSALRAVKPAAREFEHIQCPHYNAFGVVDLLFRAVLDYKPEIVILSCGPTATILANRFAMRDIQAIDFGSGGAFISKLLTS